MKFVARIAVALVIAGSPLLIAQSYRGSLTGNHH